MIRPHFNPDEDNFSHLFSQNNLTGDADDAFWSFQHGYYNNEDITPIIPWQKVNRVS